MARRNRKDIAATLIGLGLVLGLAPVVLAASPIGAAFKPLAPFGWLAFALGCGIVWWRLRGQSAATGPASAERRGAAGHAMPVRPRRPRATPVASDAAADAFAPRQETVRDKPEIDPREWSAAVFDVIEWRRFEAVVEALFAQAGFETKTQSHGADEGIDVWLYSRNNPGSPVSIVQCKHWQRKRVGVDKVRELRGVMAAKHVSRGQFATTSTFTEDAIAFAKDNGIDLLDVQGLLALIAMRTRAQQHALLEVALEGEYWKPTCVNCGIKMVERSPRKGGAAFWGCSTYPKCRTQLPMRRAAN